MSFSNNLNVGIIYTWICSGEVVYVGRTIKSLEERINGHKREYYKQLESGLVTKKFINVFNLKATWDELEFKVIEEISFEDINLLGERELYWYTYYSKIRKLWNSTRPSVTEYLSLNIDERSKRRELKQFEYIFVSKLDEIIYKLINKFYQSSLEIFIKPLNHHEFYFSQESISNDYQSILIKEINNYSEKFYFKALIGRLIELIESTKPLYYPNLSIDKIYYELYENVDVMLDIYNMCPDVNSKSLLEFAINEWAFKYKNKKTKELEYSKKIIALGDFEKNFIEKYNSICFRDDIDEDLLLYQKEILLLESVNEFRFKNPLFFDSLEAYINSSSIRGFNNQSIRTDFFKNCYGSNYLEDFFYRVYEKNENKLVPLGYDLKYITEELGFAGIYHIIRLDYNKYMNERITFFYDRTIPALFEDDESIVHSCVEINGLSIKYASDRLRNHLKIALSAVTENGLSLEFLPDDLKNNFEVVFAAVKSDGKAIHHANKSFLNDLIVTMEAAKSYPNVIKYVERDFLNNEDLALLVLSQSGKLLSLFPNKIKSNRHIVEAAITDDGNSLEFASQKLRDDFDLVKIAVMRDPESIQFASEDLQNNKIILNSLRKGDYRPSGKGFIMISKMKSKKKLKGRID